MNKRNNYTSQNFQRADCHYDTLRTDRVCFASCGKVDTARAILHLAEEDGWNWSVVIWQVRNAWLSQLAVMSVNDSVWWTSMVMVTMLASCEQVLVCIVWTLG